MDSKRRDKAKLTEKEKSIIKSENALERRIKLFYKKHSASDFAYMSPRGTKPEYRHNSKLKHPGKRTPKQPMQILAVEELVDLGIALKTQNWEAAKKSYFFLKRIL